MELIVTKKIDTFDQAGKKNGWLVELLKEDGKTKSYLTTIFPHVLKGYHLHTTQTSNYVCIKGRLKIILFTLKNQVWEREEFVMDSTTPTRFSIPTGLAIGIENISDEVAELINFPDPPFNPDNKNEQINYSLEELENNIIK